MNDVLQMAIRRAKLARPLPASDKLITDNLALKHEVCLLRATNEELKNKIHYLEKIRKFRPAEEQPSRNIDFKHITRMLAARSGFSEIVLLGAARNKIVVRWRHLLMYLAHKFTGYSLPQIGRLLGNRDHTTILHGVKKITAERIVDAQLDQLLAECERELKHGAASRPATLESVSELHRPPLADTDSPFRNGVATLTAAPSGAALASPSLSPPAGAAPHLQAAE